MEVEIFKPITGLEGLYEISNHGRIKSIRNNLYLKSRVSNCGYLRLGLRKLGISTWFSIHRLVGIHFIDNPSGYPCINHIDNDKTNNHVSNLQWCTHQMNSTHMVQQGRSASGERNCKAKLTVEQVDKVRTMRKTGMTLQAIGGHFNVTKQTVWGIVSNENWRKAS